MNDSFNIDEADEDLDARLLEQMRLDFLEEARVLMDRFEHALKTLQETPNDRDVLEELYRITHTIKGNSAFVGLEAIHSLAFEMENTFHRLRGGNFPPTPPMTKELFEAFEMLNLLTLNANRNHQDDMDITEILHKMKRIGHQKGLPS